MNVHYGDVLIKYGSILDAESDEIPYITAGKESKKQCYLSDGDVIIADTAEDETVGKCTEIANTKNAKIEAGLHTISKKYRRRCNEQRVQYRHLHTPFTG